MLQTKPTDFGASIATIDNNVIIQSGQTESSAIFTNGLPLLSVQFPSNFTTANVTFLVSLDGETYVPLKDTDGLVPTLVNASASTATYVIVTWLAGFPFFKLVSSAPQANTVNIRLGLRRVS